MKEYDAIVIGTGQSGPSLAGRFDREGMKVAVSELIPTVLQSLRPLEAD